MKKNTYQAKLAATKLTDANTIGELKAAKATKRALGKYLENAALKHIKATEGRDLKAEIVNWTELKFEYTLAPTGTVKVFQNAVTEMGPAVLRQTWTVNKKDLLS
jgi:hypothetical protein